MTSVLYQLRNTLLRPAHTVSMSTKLSASELAKYPTATFANGCFWGTEHMFVKHFGKDNTLLSHDVGYIGGDKANPSYREVCTGDTGHAEAVQLVFDPAKVSYKELVDFNFRMHDPTTLNSQGPDRGTQYRSAIFYHDEEQKKIAQQSLEEAEAKYWSKHGNRKIVTQIVPAGQWYTAEEYHQKYLHNNPHGYECPSHRLYY